MLTDEAKRLLRNWRSDSVNGVLLFGVDEAAKAGLVTWAGLLTPRGADLVATEEAAGYDPDAVEIKCDACHDTGWVSEWVDVPIMGEWTVTRERARPCEECTAQSEADRAMIESGVLHPDEIRLIRGLLNIDQLLGRGECTQIRFQRAPWDDMPPTLGTPDEPIITEAERDEQRDEQRDPGRSVRLSDVLPPGHFDHPVTPARLDRVLPPGQSDMDLYAQMVTSYKRDFWMGWDYGMAVDPLAGSASTMAPANVHSRPAMWANGERISTQDVLAHEDPEFSAQLQQRVTAAVALAKLAVTPEPEVIDVPAPVDWIYLESMRDR